MAVKSALFLEVLEWLHPTPTEVAHRLPESGSGEFKMGAQLIVRDSQAAVFFASGKACDALGPGRHTLTTANLPLLTKILSLPWGGTSPFRAEVYFVNLKIFNNLKWGTRDPVAFRDRELGLVRLRAHGICDVQIAQPVLFVNTLVGTQAGYEAAMLEDYISEIIVSRLNDHLGEHLETLLDLPSRYAELADGLVRRVADDLKHYGLGLRRLYVNAITPPAEVQGAIDDRSRLGVLGKDLGDLTRMKTAMAMEKAAEGGGQAGEGIGLGMGLMLPGLLGGMAAAVGGGQGAAGMGSACTDCGLAVEAGARFCPHCGHQQLVLRQCAKCGKNLGPKARFCPACGAAADEAPGARKCKECGTENRPESVFCNGCGVKL